jgi:hypothetical protein
VQHNPPAPPKEPVGEHDKAQKKRPAQNNEQRGFKYNEKGGRKQSFPKQKNMGPIMQPGQCNKY